MPSSEDYARVLSRYGVVCVPVLNEASRATWASRIWQAMDEFPEFKVKGPDAQRVLGGFGALGNPASFHHKVIQQWRTALKTAALVPLFREYVRLNGFSPKTTRLESLYDRICVRCATFGEPTAETWHRDIYDGAKYKLRELPRSIEAQDGTLQLDEIFGGWVNLSSENQYFIGITGSHKSQSAHAAQARGGGFATLTKAEIQAKNIRAFLKRQANQKIGTCRTNEKGFLIVPPGCMLLFYQRLLHSVIGNKQPVTPSLRMFNGVRLTGETTSLFDHRGVQEAGAVPRIPSGQIPPMYSQNHYAWFAMDPRYREWAERTFKRVCLYERVTKEGIVYYTPGSKDDKNPSANKERYMPSLRELGMAPYEYTPRSKNTMTPELLF